MKKFRVHDIRIVSRREKSAKRVEFHPKMTVIKGENGTGKSSVIKSIFWCLGAEPVFNERWKPLDICAALRFSVDDEVLTAVRHNRQFGIFDSKGRIRLSATSVTKEFGPFLANLFNFKLLLSNQKTHLAEIPPPAFYFLPFYIDQDNGWTNTWCSFENLRQYSSWKGDVAEYHVGLRDNEYYRLKTSISALKADAEEPRRQESAVIRAIEHLQSRMTHLSVDFDLTRFQAEVAELLKSASSLAEEEEQYRRKSGELSNQRAFLVQQLEIATRTHRELQKDYDFSVDQPAEIDCPTCGAVYQNSITERFRIALDEEECESLVTDLRRNIAALDEELSLHRQKMNDARQRHGRIWELLDAKRETVSLHEVLKGEARGQALSALQAETDELRRRIHDLEDKIEVEQDLLKKYNSAERKKAFLNEFSAILNRYCVGLQVVAPGAVRRFDIKLKETGSELPRLVLAYNYAVLSMFWKHSQSAQGPIVLDSPNQQDQDPANLKKMLEFIRDQTPSDAQLILGLVDPQGIEFGGVEHEFNKKAAALSPDEYPTVGVEVTRLVSAMYEVGGREREDGM